MLDPFSLEIPLSSAQKCIALNDQMVHSAIHSVSKVKMIRKTVLYICLKLNSSSQLNSVYSANSVVISSPKD